MRPGRDCGSVAVVEVGNCVRVIYEWGFFVKEDREDEFRDWLAANERLLAESAPEHYEYLGTYVPIWATVQVPGAFRQLWRHGGVRQFDMRAASEGPGAFARLVGEYLEFIDDGRADEETFALYREAAADAAEEPA